MEYVLGFCGFVIIAIVGGYLYSRNAHTNAEKNKEE